MIHCLPDASDLSSRDADGPLLLSVLAVAVQTLLSLRRSFTSTSYSALSTSRTRCRLKTCSQYGTGAYTAEIAAGQLKDAGIPWVILGHSERRQLFHTTDDVVAKQVTQALKNGLSVIACVGETLEERKKNHTWSVIEKQLNAIAGAVKGEEWDRLVVAYEPVWAIGTGETASPQQAQDVHKQIREWAEKKVSGGVANKLRIIYGGSVKGSNADELYTQKDIDGSAANTNNNLNLHNLNPQHAASLLHLNNLTVHCLALTGGCGVVCVTVCCVAVSW